MGRWQLIIVSVYVHCKTHRKRSGIEMNETLNLHRQRTKWTVDIELDNYPIAHGLKSNISWIQGKGVINCLFSGQCERD